MNGSFKIGTAFGIPIRIHWTFLVGIYLLLLLQADLLALPLFAVVFGCVLLHELGHSLVARGFGLRVVDITLWPLGGMARMSEIPENPRIEMLIAVAGPAVNFALAGLAILALLLDDVLGLRFATFFGWFLLVNLIQGGFNLIPAFPMDGGRLLRAFLGRKRDWLVATEIAARVGRVVALLLFSGSLVVMWLSPKNVCLMPLIALFIWFAGTRELLSVRLRRSAFAFGPGTPPFATAAPGGSAPPPSEPPEPGEARRPQAWGQPGNSGFSDEEIRRLESYRGRLRRPQDE